MELFSADATIFEKKGKKIVPENMKKPPSKVAHNRPRTFLFSMYMPSCPKTEILYHQKSLNAGLGI